MKTYKKEIESPRLVIRYDSDIESPREWNNVGYLITKDSRQYSPDKNPHIEGIVNTTGDIAENQEDHIRLITEVLNNEGEEVVKIFPVVKYEHGGISYKIGTTHGFDYSNNGFYIITKKSLQDFGIGVDENDLEKQVNAEIDLYNRYINGEVYCWELFDENGESEGTHGGYYSLEDIKAELPAEWKDEDLRDYLKD